MNITSPKLIFNLISKKDEGVYRCNVSNDDASVVSNNATLTVYGELNSFSLFCNNCHTCT